MLYSYIISNKRRLWTILLVNSISGIAGILIQSAFLAFNNDLTTVSIDIATCNNVLTDSSQKVLGAFLGVNEIFWYLNETTTVLYAFVKLETITTTTLPLKVTQLLRVVIGIWLIAYMPLRGYIGYLRASHHAKWDNDIAVAHSFAFISWGLVEFVIFGMLMQAITYTYLYDSTKHVTSIIVRVLSSSVLRLFIISVNQIFIAIISRFQIEKFTSLSVFDLAIWLIRGIYPMILLMDVLSTQNLLFNSSEKDRNGDISIPL
ncbi:hypothetical protein HK096_005670, partial [Nowakowskiella sp. JEL0078]